MAYITDATLKEAVAKRQGTTVAELYTTSPHLEVIVADANEQAYQTILTVLLGQGYEKSTIDSWDRREEFNRRLGVCFVYRESALLDEGKLQGLVDHLCKCEEELAAMPSVLDDVGSALAEASPIRAFVPSAPVT